MKTIQEIRDYLKRYQYNPDVEWKPLDVYRAILNILDRLEDEVFELNRRINTLEGE